MDVIYGLIPMMLFFGFLVVVVFIWMAKAGHFDDLDGAASRIFMDDDYPEDLKSTESTSATTESQQIETPESEQRSESKTH
ncbi:MAG: cbb3-type cytochrome oxidase assembly protein CcoS [Thiomicrorhabdus sp.]|jgi:cbb3-type cytochrome oxidase maturation protein|nr:cbb3-type cytochrome oxidase assembly protein CcoS [Thiomicrorhabdus sp.]